MHALCDRDGHPVPQWVTDARSPSDIPLVPDIDLDSPFGQRMRRDGPCSVPLPPGVLLGTEPGLDMRHTGPAGPAGMLLTAEAIRHLFDDLSSHLQAAQSYNPTPHDRRRSGPRSQVGGPAHLRRRRPRAPLPITTRATNRAPDPSRGLSSRCAYPANCYAPPSS